jgi:hypothetical protein
MIVLVWPALERDSGPSAGCLPATESARSPGRAAVIALLGDDRLLRISLPGAEIERERRLPGSSARRLATGPDARTVLALVRERGRDSIAVIDPATLQTRCSRRLDRGIRYSGLVLGRSGRFYAYGSRPAEVPRRFDAVLTVGDLRTGRLAGSHTLREAARGRWRGTGTDWNVYDAALSPDERRVVVSYHGHDTTGADQFHISPGSDISPSGRAKRLCARRPRWCRTPGVVDVGWVHGAVAALGTGFVAAAAEAGVLELDRNGRETRRSRVRTQSHLMEFVLDEARSRVYVSACGRRPAIHRLELARRGHETLRSGRVCGAPLAIHDGRFLILAASRVGRRGYTELQRPPRLRIIDLERPGAGQPVPGADEPVDAVALAP